jgi:DNA (cytosine-5)-methyltransferase 1
VKYGSVCSGVEAATVAWHGLGWQPQWFSEIEKFPSAVLQHHYPETPNLGDMTAFKEWRDDPIDLLVGGTPCQSFSVAGLRKGLADPRGNLMLTYLAIAERYQPRWLVWENVPGVLSSNRGRDFGTFLGALGQLGYGFSYRVLDAQYFGVAQRRRRVFVVGYLGDWRRAAAVLFEREGMLGHPAPSREAREEATGYTSGSFGGYSEGVGTVRAAGGELGGGSETLVAKCLTSRVGSAYDAQTEQFVTEQKKVNAITASYGTGGPDYETKPLVYGQPVAFPAEMSGTQAASTPEMSPTLSVGHTTAVAFSSKDYGADAMQDCSPTLRAGGHDKSHQNGGVPPAVAYGMDHDHNVAKELMGPLIRGPQGAPRNAVSQNLQVRRLTPIECERLQGFPDNYTQIPWRNKDAADCPDGPRYKAMGNSMAVPVMRWIGERIQMVEDMSQ